MSRRHGLVLLFGFNIYLSSHQFHSYFYVSRSTEVLEAFGVIDMDEIASDKRSESMKQRVMNRLSFIKRSVTSFDLKAMVNNPKQKSGALGIAAGALLGFLL